MKKNLYGLFIMLFMIPINISALEITEEIIDKWGGTKRDILNNVVATKDGGFVAVGASQSSELFQDIYPGYSISETDAITDAIIVKYDNEGNEVWKNVIGGDATETFSDVVETEDNGFIAIGQTKGEISGLDYHDKEDALIVKYDGNGKLVWKDTFGGTKSEIFSSIIKVNDGYLVVGYSASTDYDLQGLDTKGNFDILLVKYKEDGTISWKKVFGGSELDSPDKIKQTPDGGYVIVGASQSDILDKNNNTIANKGLRDALILKLNSNFELEWQKTYGGSGDDRFNGIEFTEDGGYIVVGGASSSEIIESIGGTDIKLINKGTEKNSIKDDAIIVRYDKDGNVIWHKNFGGSEKDAFADIYKTEDNEYYVIGSGDSLEIDGLPNGKYGYILTYNLEGDYDIKYTYLTEKWTSLKGIDKLNSNDLVVVGQFHVNVNGFDSNGGHDGLIVRLISKKEEKPPVDDEENKNDEIKDDENKDDSLTNDSGQENEKEKPIENPKTSDNIKVVFVISGVSLIGLITSIIYLKKELK